MKWVNSDKFHPADNSALCLICTKNLYSDGDELSIVDCTKKNVILCLFLQLKVFRFFYNFPQLISMVYEGI